MTGQKSQSTFITNNENRILKERISKLIGFSKELKFLVGFFYFSGIRELYEAIKSTPDLTVKVLVGLNVDKTNYGLIEYGDTGKIGGNKHQALFKDSIIKSINTDEFDNPDFYEQAKFFIQCIIDNKLVIRKTREPNHAKLYFFKIKDEHKDLKPCCFITGSSNLTRAGLSQQNEFNVEISDYGTQEAEDYFDELWDKKSVKITEDNIFKLHLINILKTSTLLAEVTPYEAFAFVLKTYLELQKPKNLKEYIFKLLEEKGYRKYKYQVDAVAQALNIIEQHNGVIIADVVGLGKSIIAGMVAKCLNKRGIIICPPALMGGIDDKGERTGWEKYRHDFELNFWEIRSLGLETLRATLNLVQNENDYEVIIIDEVHRFRNQDTEAYEILSNICRDKIVIMLTATPFNNTPADIFSLLKLFIVPGKSKITLSNNLDDKFRHYNQVFKRLSNIKKNHNSSDKKKRDSALNDYKALFESDKIDLNKVTERAKYLSKDIRSVISQVTIRRNRIDLKKDPEYSKEIYELSEVRDPCEAFFELTPEQSEFYDKVISVFFGENGLFTGAIYRPFVYEAGKTSLPEDKLDEEENREALIQKNLYDFMRRLLVKRFESSFGAFKQSINNFKSITEKVQQFIEKSGKYILDRKLIDQISQYDEDEIEEELKEFEQRLTDGNYPKHYKVYNVNEFAEKDKFLADIQADLNLFGHIIKELERLELVDNDPKLDRLSRDLVEIMQKKDKATEPARKVVIFSEYVDTVKYVEAHLLRQFPSGIISVKGDFGKEKATEILSNFDTTYKHKSNKYQILIATDKMSEGFNLNRAGAVINLDIPWNPTRVVQRVGRINRISKKVFDNLYIYNFFPTEQGAEYVKSRQIAGEKMFMIHNTLGEDAKIFAPDEEPTAAKLFEKIQENPDNLEQESFQTSIRRMYSGIDESTKQKISSLPSRIKVAKKYSQYALTVFIKKGLGLFIRNISGDNKEPTEMLFEEALPLIQCVKDEKSLPLSDMFWDNYFKIKELKDKVSIPFSDLSLEKKAYYNVKTLLADKSGSYQEFQRLLLNLVEDIEDYKTLSDYTLRRIANLETTIKDEKKIARVKEELISLRQELGEDYLDKIKQKIGMQDKEVIIAIENIGE